MSDLSPSFIHPQPEVPWWRAGARAARRALLRRGMERAPIARKKEWNRDLNWREFWHGRTRLASFPRIIQVGTNWTCNLRCSFCRLSMPWMREHLHQKPAAELQISPAVFAAVKRLLPYAEMMTLTPLGEPLLWGGLGEMLQYHAGLGTRNLALTSNGMLLEDAMAERLVRGELSALYLSVDSNDPEVYASMRVGGDLRRVEEGMRRLRAWKARLGVPWPQVTVNATFMARNIDQLATMVDWARGLGCDALSVQLMEMENPALEEEFLGHHVDRARLALAAALARGGEVGLTVRPHAALLSLIEAAAEAPADRPRPPLVERCSLPWHNLLIDTDGEVRPCCWAGASWGNLNRGDFDACWNGPQAQGMRQAFLRNIVPRPCRQRHCRVDL